MQTFRARLKSFACWSGNAAMNTTAPVHLRTPAILSYASFALMPLYLAQGMYVRCFTPRLPDAAGADHGIAKPVMPISHHQPVHLLVTGESPVAGVGVRTHHEAITGQLAQALAERLQREIHWRAFGGNGYTAQQVRIRLLPLLSPQEIHLAVIALGVNDTLKMRSTSRWRSDLIALITALRARVGDCPVLLAGVPPMQHFPALPSPLNKFLGWRARLLDEAAVSLTSQIESVQHAPMPSLNIRDFFCEDGFHPSAIGYKVWANHLAEVATKFLQSHN